MKQKNSKKLDPKVWVVGAVALAVLALWAMGEQKDMERDDGQGTTTYESAVAQYEGRRFQFDLYCQPIPKQATLKSGTAIMLDNRSAQPRSVKIGNDTYLLAGNDWRVVTVSSQKVPATIYIDCDGSKNVGTIFLEG